MGVFQRGINNLLAEAGVVASVVSKDIQDKKLAKAEVEKAKTIEAQNKIEADKKAQEKLQADIKSGQEKYQDAVKMAIGYTKKDIQAQKARQAQGLEPTNKNPRGVSNKSRGWRETNAKLMLDKILPQFEIDENFRNRMSKFTVSQIAESIRPDIRHKPKQGGSK